VVTSSLSGRCADSLSFVLFTPLSIRSSCNERQHFFVEHAMSYAVFSTTLSPIPSIRPSAARTGTFTYATSSSVPDVWMKVVTKNLRIAFSRPTRIRHRETHTRTPTPRKTNGSAGVSSSIALCHIFANFYLSSSQYARFIYALAAHFPSNSYGLVLLPDISICFDRVPLSPPNFVYRCGPYLGMGSYIRTLSHGRVSSLLVFVTVLR
jgi:hypothetical protein